VEAEYRRSSQDGAPHTITQAEFDRVEASFVPPASRLKAPSRPTRSATGRFPPPSSGLQRWLQQNVAPHKNPDLRAVTLSFKRPGYAPGDATADQLEQAADLAERFSAGEARVSHDQNLVLPWVRARRTAAALAGRPRRRLGPANIRLLTDMIACPGGDFCALANARSLPIAEAITERYQDMDELHDLGEIDLHISGCINSCGHHHSGHIGILGVDKDGRSGTRSRWAAPTAPR
jgi:sulfite reductase (NADPH) hemoprotein beta-component